MVRGTPFVNERRRLTFFVENLRTAPQPVVRVAHPAFNKNACPLWHDLSIGPTPAIMTYWRARHLFIVYSDCSRRAWPVEVPFGAQLVISTAGVDAHHTIAADQDGDGDLDVLAASSGDGEIDPGLQP